MSLKLPCLFGPERDKQEFLGERLFKMCLMDFVHAWAFLMIVINTIYTIIIIVPVVFSLSLVLYIYIY